MKWNQGILQSLLQVGMVLRFTAVVLILVATLIKNVDNRHILKFSSINCNALDWTMVNFTLCEIKALSRDVEEISIKAAVLRKPLRNISLSISIKKRGFANSRAFYEGKYDVCAFQRNRRRNPLAVVFYKVLGFEEYSNMNHPCPYDHDLILDKYRFNQDYLTLLPLPTGDFSITITVHLWNVPRGNIIVNFQIIDV